MFTEVKQFILNFRKIQITILSQVLANICFVFEGILYWFMCVTLGGGVEQSEKRLRSR